MFGRMLKNFFWNTWDNLGKVLGFSLIGSLLNLPLIFGVVVLWGSARLTPEQLFLNRQGPTSVARMSHGRSTNRMAGPATNTRAATNAAAGQAENTPRRVRANLAFNKLFSLLLVLLLSFTFPVMGGVYGAARRNIEGTNTKFLRDFWECLQENFGRSLLVFLINAVIYIMFFTAFNFYLFFPPLERIAALQWGMIGITGWLFFFFTLMQIYLIPLIIHKKEAVFLVYKKAALLVVDNIAQGIAVFLFSMVMLALSLYSVVIITLLLPGVWAMLHVTNFYVLLQQYEPPELPSSGEDGKRDFSAENETRSWRSIFRPWEQ